MRKSIKLFPDAFFLAADSIKTFTLNTIYIYKTKVILIHPV
ncbi:hypothetical protein B14911_12552 [Bacillus sp. NRRL B-14911]|uniref:Uncharacterized protein n=1 Tax=Bacillus infantis NRRL B-14911 TaxID=1367477 RepID=U5LJ93_9BACI|nr:hypothetical protein N288_24235 [Bacillus infantis NRRL B-14911]EAR67593.1 hypothetical protein B14911_12552 [Bacillus sp. NRRL B-14911]